MDKRIGAQYYTIRDFCQTLDDFEKSCEKVSKIGYKTVQLSAIGDFEPNDIKTILDKNNLKAVCTHRPADNYLNNIEKEIEFHKIIRFRLSVMDGKNQCPIDSRQTDRYVQLDFS